MPDDKGFEIRDKRISQGGEGEAASPESREAPNAKEETLSDLPSIDFLAFLSSLGATALMHLGERLTTDQPESYKDLPAAKQMIDLIALLKEKTKGNLDKDESEMLEHLLYNLRMRYVRAAEGK